MSVYGPAWQATPFATLDDVSSGIISQAFSTFPAPSAGIAGLVMRANDAVFPAPGLDLVCTGTRWRPVGDQVLRSGPSSEITLQNAAEQAMLVIGPFPGGLVKLGDTLSMRVIGRLPGVSTAQRYVQVHVGAAGTIADSYAFTLSANTSLSNAAAGDFSVMPMLFVNSDANAIHYTTSRWGANHEVGLYSQSSNNPAYTPTIDFSVPWYVTLSGQSIAETAVNITSSSWSGGVATHISTAHTLNTGDKTVIAGVSLAGYNNTFSPVTRIDANTFTVPLAANPGGAGTGGTTSRVSNIILQRYRLMWSS